MADITFRPIVDSMRGQILTLILALLPKFKINENRKEYTMHNKNPFLTVGQLARRWKMTAATLRQWRWFDKGPQFHKIGGRALYKLDEIERFENELIRAHTTAENKPSLEDIEQLVSQDIPSKKDH